MEQKNITISKQVLLKAYRKAEPSQKEFMEQLFGVDTFASNVMERVKTLQDAINELGDEHPLVRQFVCVCNFAFTFNNSGMKLDADIIAYLKLRIITAALNEGWEPKFTKDECRYYPYFYFLTKEEYDKLDDDDKRRVVGRADYGANSGGGLVCSYANVASSYSFTLDGVRLAFKTLKLAEYAGKQFIDIWADFVFKIGGTEKTEAE
jgi:hypothetical protein